ncbi:hypothetical protein JCM17380_45360 [Desulfosporosinus burensis]
MGERIRVTEALSQADYASLLEYCITCNYLFLDELTPLDFVAYKSKYDVDSSVVKQLKMYVRNYVSKTSSLSIDSELNINITEAEVSWSCQIWFSP